MIEQQQQQQPWTTTTTVVPPGSSSSSASPSSASRSSRRQVRASSSSTRLRSSDGGSSSSAASARLISSWSSLAPESTAGVRSILLHSEPPQGPSSSSRSGDQLSHRRRSRGAEDNDQDEDGARTINTPSSSSSMDSAADDVIERLKLKQSLPVSVPASVRSKLESLDSATLRRLLRGVHPSAFGSFRTKEAWREEHPDVVANYVQGSSRSEFGDFADETEDDDDGHDKGGRRAESCPAHHHHDHHQFRLESDSTSSFLADFSRPRPSPIIIASQDDVAAPVQADGEDNGNGNDGQQHDTPPGSPVPSTGSPAIASSRSIPSVQAMRDSHQQHLRERSSPSPSPLSRYLSATSGQPPSSPYLVPPSPRRHRHQHQSTHDHDARDDEDGPSQGRSSNTRVPSSLGGGLRRIPSNSSLASECTCVSSASTTTSRASSVHFAPLPEEEILRERQRRNGGSSARRPEMSIAMGVKGRVNNLQGIMTERDLLIHNLTNAAKSTSSSSPSSSRSAAGDPGSRMKAVLEDGDEIDDMLLENAFDGELLRRASRSDEGSAHSHSHSRSTRDDQSDDEDALLNNSSGFTIRAERNNGRQRNKAEYLEKRPLGVTLEELVLPPKRHRKRPAASEGGILETGQKDRSSDRDSSTHSGSSNSSSSASADVSGRSSATNGFDAFRGRSRATLDLSESFGLKAGRNSVSHADSNSFGDHSPIKDRPTPPDPHGVHTEQDVYRGGVDHIDHVPINAQEVQRVQERLASRNASHALELYQSMASSPVYENDPTPYQTPRFRDDVSLEQTPIPTPRSSSPSMNLKRALSFTRISELPKMTALTALRNREDAEAKADEQKAHERAHDPTVSERGSAADGSRHPPDEDDDPDSEAAFVLVTSPSTTMKDSRNHDRHGNGDWHDTQHDVASLKHRADQVRLDPPSHSDFASSPPDLDAYSSEVSPSPSPLPSPILMQTSSPQLPESPESLSDYDDFTTDEEDDDEGFGSDDSDPEDETGGMAIRTPHLSSKLRRPTSTSSSSNNRIRGDSGRVISANRRKGSNGILSSLVGGGSRGIARKAGTGTAQASTHSRVRQVRTTGTTALSSSRGGSSNK